MQSRLNTCSQGILTYVNDMRNIASNLFGGREVKRTPLRKVSKKKAAWLVKYRAEKKRRLSEMMDKHGHLYDEETGETCNPEPHHPNGRTNDNIMNFVFITAERHRWIHEHPNEARAKGLLK